MDYFEQKLNLRTSTLSQGILQLRDQIIEDSTRRASGVVATLGLQALTVPGGDQGPVNLLDPDALLSRWNDSRDRVKERWHRNAQRLGVVSKRVDLPDLLASLSSRYSQRIEDEFTRETWARFRGEAFEWAMLLGLIWGAKCHINVRDGILAFGGREGASVEIQPGMYLWFQSPVRGAFSRLNVRPDFVITDEPVLSFAHVKAIIEAKNKDVVGGPELRGVLGMALDLSPDMAALASFAAPSPRLSRAAHGLGVSLLGFPQSHGGMSVAGDFVFGRLRSQVLAALSQQHFRNFEHRRYEQVFGKLGRRG